MKIQPKRLMLYLSPYRVAFITLCIAILQLLTLQLSECADNALYKLGAEDVITITVLGHTDMSGEYFIPTDGMINLPRVGGIFVIGKTVPEVAELVTTQYCKILRQPDVAVSLKTPRDQLIYVMGVVQKPGSYSIKPGWSIPEAVSAAGGLNVGLEQADCTVSVLRSSTGFKQTVAFLDAVRGNGTAKITLEAGDVITVESMELIPVYVMGKVSKPGVYNLRRDSAGVLEAITVAGGTLDDASLTKVTVTHVDGKYETVNILQASVNGKNENPIKLSAGDLVVVPDSNAKFAVLGWVREPGFFPLKENQQCTLSDALGLAKGVDNKRGGLSKVAILRMVDGKQQRIVYDYTKFLKHGDITQNPQILASDIVWVPETSRPDWDRVTTTVTSLLSSFWIFGR